MTSGSWFIFFICICFLILGVIVTAYLIAQAEYDALPKNTFKSGDVVNIRSLEADSKPLQLPSDCVLENDYDDPYKNKCLINFTGSETDAWILNTKSPIVRRDIDLTTSLTRGKGNRLFFSNLSGVPVAVLSVTEDKNKNKYIVATEAKKYDTDNRLLGSYFSQKNGVTTSGLASSSSDPLYNIVFPLKGINSGSTRGQKSQNCGGGVSQTCDNDGIARLRPTPVLEGNNPEVYYNNPGLAIYDSGTLDQRGVELEFLFDISNSTT